MARGWESKGVEQQQAEAASVTSAPARRLTPEQASRQREQEGLHLSRQRLVQQLERALNPAHREMLERALADLDQRLARLG